MTPHEPMTALVEGGMSMIAVTHEMGFSRCVADTVSFLDEGQILYYTCLG